MHENQGTPNQTVDKALDIRNLGQGTDGTGDAGIGRCVYLEA